MTGLTGCQFGPFPNQQVASKRDPVDFGGFTVTPNDTVRVQALDLRDNSWDEIASTTTTDSGYADAVAANWYGWSIAGVRLPQSTVYWTHRGSGNNRFIDIKVRSFSDAIGALQVVSSVDCAGAAFGETGQGAAVATRCGTGGQGTLSVPCGDRNESCCVARGTPSNCEPGLSCSSGLCVTAGMPTEETPEGPVIIPPPGMSCKDMEGAPCTAQPNVCNVGYTEVMGKIQCSNNRPVCKVTNGVDFCQRGGSLACGAAATQSCQIDEQCGPGSLCDQSNGSCRPFCRLADNYCWHPRQNPMTPSEDGKNESGCVEFF